MTHRNRAQFAPRRTRTSSLGRSYALAALLGLAACGDSTSGDPATGTGSQGSGGSGAQGSGGSGAQGSGGSGAPGSGGAGVSGSGGSAVGTGGAQAGGGGSSTTTGQSGAGGSGGAGGSVANTGGASGDTAGSGGSGGARVDSGIESGAPAPRDAASDAPSVREAAASDPPPGDYHPCPAKGTVCRIMPMGDSITEGFRASDNRGGYRSRLFHLTLQNKKSITFVGSAPLWGPTTVDGVMFPQQNEGIGGRRIEALIDITPAMSTAAKPNTIVVNKPNILLLEIGTNNFNDGASGMATKLETLLDRIIASDPNLLVVLAKIIPTTTDSKTAIANTYNGMMPAMVKARADAGKHIILTDMYAPIVANANYKTALMKDELHPNDAGYTVMAQAWYDAIQSYLP